MISPELLRRYPVFGMLSDTQLKQIAMISEEETIGKDVDIFEEGQPGDKLYLLINGSLDLYYVVKEEFKPDIKKEFLVGEVNPGEMFGFSALVEPYRYSSTIRTSTKADVVMIDAEALRGFLNEDPVFSAKMMHNISKIILERLTATRVQLAAAWA